MLSELQYPSSTSTIDTGVSVSWYWSFNRVVLRFQLIGTGRIVVLAFKRSSMEVARTVAESLAMTCALSRREGACRISCRLVLKRFPRIALLSTCQVLYIIDEMKRRVRCGNM